MAEQNPDKKFVMFKKINVRDLFRISKCSTGLHIWVSPKLIEAFNLQRGDKLWIRIEEVRYHNLREVPII